MPRPSRIVPALAGMALLAPPALAQDGEAGGVRLRFSLDQRLEAVRNADLDPTSRGTTWRTDTRLGLALSSQTQTDFLGLTLDGSLRHVEAPDTLDDVPFGFKAPSATLRYSHTAATARFETTLSASRQDVSYLRSLSDILADLDEGEVVFLDDLEDEAESGTRQTLRADAALRLGVGGPAELGFSLNAREVSYDTSGASYTDSRSYGARSDLRLQLTPDLTLRSALGYRLFEEDGAPARETWTLGNTLTQDRADGSVSARLDLARIEEGTRATLGFGWTQDLPRGRLALELGATRAANGDSGLTGSLNWRHVLKTGSLDARLSHAFAPDSDDRESRVTRLSAGYTQALGPLTSLRLDMAFARVETPDTGERTTRSDLGAAVSHQLTEDWRLSFGYRHIWADEDPGRPAQSDTVYVTVGRGWSIRF